MNDAAQAFIDKARSLLIEEYLPRIELCLEKLDDEQIWWRPNQQSNSIGNLILHLAGNARQWIVCGVGSEADDRVRQAEFDERSVIPAGKLLALTRRTLEDAEVVLLGIDTSRILEKRRIQGHDVTVLDAIFHVVEHFSMHTGQIIVLTKLLKSVDMEFYDFPEGTPTPSWRG